MRFGLKSDIQDAFLLAMLLGNILLASTTEIAKRGLDPRHKPGGVFCKPNQKPSQMASKAATDAKAAKDAQSCAADAASHRVKAILADRAVLASKGAEAALAGKKQLLDQLLESLAETKGAMEEVQRAIDASTIFSKTVCRIREKARQRLANMQSLFKEEWANVEGLRRMVASAQRAVMEKRSLLNTAMGRVAELHACMKEAQTHNERNREIAKKANCSAAEAKKRIETMRLLVSKIKKLKRMDGNP